MKSSAAHGKQLKSEKLLLLRLPKLELADQSVQSLMGIGQTGERKGGETSLGGKSASKNNLGASLQSLSQEQLLQLKAHLESLHQEIKSVSSSVDAEVEKLSPIVKDFPSFPVFCSPPGAVSSSSSSSHRMKSPVKSKRLTARSQTSTPSSLGNPLSPPTSGRSKARNRSLSMEDDELGNDTKSMERDDQDGDEFEDDPDVEEEADEEPDEEEEEAEPEDELDPLDGEFSTHHRSGHSDSATSHEPAKRKGRRKSKKRRGSKSSRSRGKRSNKSDDLADILPEEAEDESANAYAQQCNYWATIEPYIAAITPHDLELLMPSEDDMNDPDFQFPSLGRGFSERWSFEEEPEGGFDSAYPPNPKCGDLTQRILSALLEEKILMPSDLHFDLRDSTDLDPDVPVVTSYSQKNMNSLEERIREELAKIGLLDNETPNPVQGEDDEISMELKSLQEQLLGVVHKSNLLKHEFLVAASRDAYRSEAERQQRAENYFIEEIFVHKMQQINSKNKRRSRVGRPRKAD